MSTDLVPRRHVVTGDIAHIRNLIAQREARGEIVAVHSAQRLPGGRMRAEVTLLDRRKPLPVRILSRATLPLRRKWRQANRIEKAIGIMLTIGGTVLAAFLGYAIYLIVELVTAVVHWIGANGYLLIGIGICAAAAVAWGFCTDTGRGAVGSFVSTICDRCGRPF